MIRYWIYEDIVLSWVRVHRSDCLWCNDGRGLNNIGPSNNSRWHSPFTDPDKAFGYAKALGRRDTAKCTHCLGGDHL